MSPARIETLADGVFAIAMTLPVLDLAVLDVPPECLTTALVDLLPRFVVYATSFVVLGVYWVAHHAQFRVIDVADRPLLWINILLLMLVAFVPFSTSLLGRYFPTQAAVDVYGLVLILIGGAMYLHLVVRDDGPSTHSPGNERGIHSSRETPNILLAPVISALAILVSFLRPFVSVLMYALLPPFYILPGGIDRHFFRRRS